MQSSAKTVDEYLKEIPADRREMINAVRMIILANLPKGYEECMSYGMIGYVVPHSIYPKGYQCDPTKPLPLANLASQKNHMALYLMCCYGHTPTREWFEKAWKAAGKKLDMGKACVRFKKLDDISLDVIGQLFARVPVAAYISQIEKVFAENVRQRAAEKAAKGKPSKTKPAKKKAAK